MYTRREILDTVLGIGVAAYSGETLFGASNFWDRKAPDQWSPVEMDRFKSNSPWAQKVLLEIKGKALPANMDSSGSPGTFGGMRGADSNGISDNRGRARGTGNAQSQQVREVVVRWESAPPMQHATGWNPPSAFQDSYAIGVTGLPSAVVIMAVSEAASSASVSEDPEARKRASVQRLLSDTTLTAKSRDPRTADFVVQSSDRASLIFGFAILGPSRTLQAFTLEDREIVFRMELGAVTIHAKFEPKGMTVNGQLVL